MHVDKNRTRQANRVMGYLENMSISRDKQIVYPGW